VFPSTGHAACDIAGTKGCFRRLSVTRVPCLANLRQIGECASWNSTSTRRNGSNREYPTLPTERSPIESKTQVERFAWRRSAAPVSCKNASVGTARTRPNRTRTRPGESSGMHLVSRYREVSSVVTGKPHHEIGINGKPHSWFQVPICPKRRVCRMPRRASSNRCIQLPHGLERKLDHRRLHAACDYLYDDYHYYYYYCCCCCCCCRDS